MKLLSGPDLRLAIERVTSGRRVACAVAFWGRGAEALIGNPTERDVRVICNLRMGGTNPTVIEKLLAIGIAVRQCDVLHAKLYVGDHEAVVTSANASTNGLGVEGADVGWIEAGVVIPAEAALEWFEKLWAASRPVAQPDDIDAALAIFARRQKEDPTTYIHPTFDEPKDSSNLEEIQGEVSVLAPAKGAFYGKSLRACIRIVLETAGKSMTVREIAHELTSHGVSTAARDVASSVSDALRTPKAVQEFARLGFKNDKERLWALTEWPEAANAVPLPTPKKKVSKRRQGEHADRTLAGLTAARERGVRFGPPEKITAEKLAEIERMMADGIPVAQIADQMKVSKSGIYMRLRRNRDKYISESAEGRGPFAMKD